MSQSAIAEGGSVVTADQINYETKLFSHPSYKYEPQFPNTFGSPINLTTSQTIFLQRYLICRSQCCYLL